MTHLFPPQSWQRTMVSKCRSPHMLSVKPKKTEALLFYSQLPDGRPDRSSLHGGCPVLLVSIFLLCSACSNYTYKYKA
jgi:hypothetical protein